ncbi:hypothetical protein CPAR01_06255 [Colletotrichum paranaense]|uniref:DUF7918 domain-containing protein n=1 Tax=Colletotrichum paranaense TaxID=1914294 RepID=A0ABQ9STM3_9PEZI|nr:uncharacterized protein CPAR01_06255 [Colletotrichum paranaense]KAK1542868.1 hypothetical protein CPAR01_06255 [Colletotrichum paranaense]
MAGFDFNINMRVVITVAGAPAPERNDVTAESLENSAPFSCSKVIAVKEGAKFSILASPGAGICRLLAKDEGLMVLIHFDDDEVLRRLYTKTVIDARASRRFPMEFFGVTGVNSKGRQVLQPFKFATAKNDGSAIRGTIRVDLYIVKLLGAPERQRLDDTTAYGSSVQTKRLGSGKKVKKALAADTYDVKRLNYERPIARFNFKYGPRGDLPVHRPKDNNESNHGEGLINMSKNPALSKQGPGGVRGADAKIPSCSLPAKLRGLPEAPAQTQTTAGAKSASTTTTLPNKGDKLDAQLNERVVPIRRKLPEPIAKEQKFRRDIPHGEAVSIQETQPKDAHFNRKRSAEAAFGNDSPSRPKKFLATSTY